MTTTSLTFGQCWRCSGAPLFCDPLLAQSPLPIPHSASPGPCFRPCPLYWCAATNYVIELHSPWFFCLSAGSPARVKLEMKNYTAKCRNSRRWWCTRRGMPMNNIYLMQFFQAVYLPSWILIRQQQRRSPAKLGQTVQFVYPEELFILKKR